MASDIKQEATTTTATTGQSEFDPISSSESASASLNGDSCDNSLLYNLSQYHGSSSNIAAMDTDADRERGGAHSDNTKDDKYWERRKKNNEAAKRSREKRRLNDVAMEIRIGELSRENVLLKEELNALRKRFLGSSETVNNNHNNNHNNNNNNNINLASSLPYALDFSSHHQRLVTSSAGRGDILESNGPPLLPSGHDPTAAAAAYKCLLENCILTARTFGMNYNHNSDMKVSRPSFLTSSPHSLWENSKLLLPTGLYPTAPLMPAFPPSGNLYPPAPTPSWFHSSPAMNGSSSIPPNLLSPSNSLLAAANYHTTTSLPFTSSSSINVEMTSGGGGGGGGDGSHPDPPLPLQHRLPSRNYSTPLKKRPLDMISLLETRSTAKEEAPLDLTLSQTDVALPTLESLPLAPPALTCLVNGRIPLKHEKHMIDQPPSLPKLESVVGNFAPRWYPSVTSVTQNYLPPHHQDNNYASGQSAAAAAAAAAAASFVDASIHETLAALTASIPKLETPGKFPGGVSSMSSSKNNNHGNNSSGGHNTAYMRLTEASLEDLRYRERRRRNNEAVRRCRENKKNRFRNLKLQQEQEHQQLNTTVGCSTSTLSLGVSPSHASSTMRDSVSESGHC